MRGNSSVTVHPSDAPTADTDALIERVSTLERCQRQEDVDGFGPRVPTVRRREVGGPGPARPVDAKQATSPGVDLRVGCSSCCCSSSVSFSER